MSVKRLYRVTATYPDGRVVRRDFQSRGAALDRRNRVMDSTEVTGVKVTVTASDPVTWPNDGSP